MRAIAILGLVVLSFASHAEIISVRVAGVIQNGSTLVPDVPVGSAFEVTVSYSDTLMDLNPQVAVGLFNLTDPVISVHGHINGFEFRNRITPQLEVRVRPATLGNGVVNVTVRNQGNNLYVPNPPAGLDYLPLHMNWALGTTPGSTFLADASLPTVWPELEQATGITQSSITWQFQIGAQAGALSGQINRITSGSPVPVPGALILLTTPLLVLTRQMRVKRGQSAFS